MKTFLVLRPRRQLSKSEAWGCFTANLAMPGSGSLVAGYRVGYAQLVLSAIALCMTTTTCIQFMTWYLHNWQRLQPNYYEDAIENLREIWIHLHWPLISLGVFVVALAWGMITSVQILSDAGKSTSAMPPPIIR